MTSCPFEDFFNIYDKIECRKCPLIDSCGTASDFDKLLFEYVKDVLYLIDEALFKEDE